MKLTDEDWQAIADDADCIVWSGLKQAVDRRLATLAAARAEPAGGRDEREAKSLAASVADALRPFLQPGQKVIWRQPFRWFDDGGVMSNHYDGMSLQSLAAEFGYEVIHDCECAGIIAIDAARASLAQPAVVKESLDRWGAPGEAMNEPNDGGPAFPVEVGARPIGQNWHQTGPNAAQHYGMSLREHFAGLAMQAILSRLAEGIRPQDCIRASEDAYFIADAMLRARTGDTNV